MDKLDSFQKAIKEVMTEYQKRFRQTSYDIQSHLLVDDTHRQYQFLWTGWQDRKRVFTVVFHIAILKDKVWIQQDKTEIGIANLLVDKGIAKSDIVLAYFSPAHRKYTEFAVA